MIELFSMNKLNEYQKIVIIIWFVLIALCFLFPPFFYTHIDIVYPSNITSTVVRYGFLFADPPKPEMLNNTFETYGSFSWLRLLFEVMSISFLSGAVFFFFSIYKPKKNISQPPSNSVSS